MILIKRNPLKREIVEVAPNRRVIDYLLDYDENEYFESSVFINNEKLNLESDDTKDFERTLREGDILLISYAPSDPVTAGIIVGGVVLAAAVAIALTPKPKIPASVGETSSSPNNSVSGQTNTVRKYEGIPNIYGRVFSYPDLISNAIPEWVSNRKQVRELFLIGEGEYQINQIRDDKTDINDIPSASATIYGPSTYPSDLYRVAFASNVDNEELIAPDSSTLEFSTDDMDTFASAQMKLRPVGSVSFDAPNLVTFTHDPSSTDFELAAGDQITISGSTSNDGTYTLLSFVKSTNTYELTLDTSSIVFGSDSNVNISIDRVLIRLGGSGTVAIDLGIAVGDSVTVSYFGADYIVGGIDYSFGSSSVLYLKFGDTLPSYPVDVSTTIRKAGENNIVGPFTMPTTSSQIWFNVVAPNGLQSESGGTISVTCTLFAQEIDSVGNPVGSPISQQVTLSGNDSKQKGKTVKFTSLSNPDDNKYEVYAQRETNEFSGNAVQTVNLEEVFTVNSYSGEKFGNVTVLDVLTKTSKTENQSSRKINVDVTRKLNGVVTTNFADAVVDLITNKGKRPITEIDTEELYDIADGLSDDLKEFSFTFDDKNISLGEAVQAACNVARVKAYRDGQTWRFTRDEAKPRTYLFNRRNLAGGDNQNQTFSARQPDEYDSVVLRYYNREIEGFDDVLIKIDTDTESFIVGESGSYPNQIELAGCSNYAQALNRAHLEARKIVYQRWSIEDVALSDAANTTIGDRVAWGDIYDGEIFEGEIRGQNGTTYYTSEPIDLSSGDYFALVTNENGETMGPVSVSSVAGNEKAFVATLPEAVGLADGFDIQAGSKYLIGTNDDLDLYDFSVVELGESGQDGRVSIKLIQYSNKIYEMDN